MRLVRKFATGALVISLVCVIFFSGLASADPVYPNDPFFNGSAGLLFMDAAEAWGVTQGDPAIHVAVIDSGVSSVPDLAGALLPGMNFWPGAGSSDTSDANGHGTAMASIIAARINNNIGSAGICPQCSILPIRVAGPDGHWTADVLAQAIDWAASQGVRVINLSLGQAPGEQAASLNAAVCNAVARGIVVVIGAGNGGTSDPDNDHLASDNQCAIRVATAYGLPSLLVSISNHGSWVEVAALEPTVAATTDGNYRSSGGTSTAAAEASGITGLLLSFNPALSPVQVKSILMSSCTKQGIDVACGGVVNIYQALITAGYVPPKTQALTVNISGSGSVKDSTDAIDCSAGSCSADFKAGTDVSLTAAPDSGSVFAGWSGACTSRATVCQVTLNNDVTVTAGFSPRKWPLTITKIGPGMVKSTPLGVVCRQRATRCTSSFATATVVRLTATPIKGGRFIGWRGACHGRQPCKVTLTAPMRVTAVFARAKVKKR